MMAGDQPPPGRPAGRHAGAVGKTVHSDGPLPRGSAKQVAALTALGTALRQATHVLRDGQMRSPADALLIFAAADRALQDAPDFLAALQPLVEIGEPADVVVAELAVHQEQFADLERQAIPLKQQLRTLLDSAEQYRAEADKRDEIEQRIAELRRIEQLATEVAELRAQADVLEARTAEASLEVSDAGACLGKAGARFVTLSGELLAALDCDMSELLLRADKQDRQLRDRLAERRAMAECRAADTSRLQQELTAVERDAAEADTRFDELHASAAGRLSALRRYAASDREISESLSLPKDSDSGSDAESRGAAAILDHVEKQLAQVDAELASKLAEHDQRRAAAIIPRRLKKAGAPAPTEEGRPKWGV